MDSLHKKDDAGSPGNRGQKPAEVALCFLGDYLLLGEIARGGMGVVYHARQISLDREVAVKTVRAGLLGSNATIQRFHAEARALAALDHPNIVSVYEVGEDQGVHFFSMKFIEGGSLAARIEIGDGGGRAESSQRQKGRFAVAPSESARLLAKVARAVHFAHERGVVHRDLKPGNILLNSAGEPLVSDFGLAKFIVDDVALTQSQDVLGTPHYMSPEQAAGESHDVTFATDIYSLGVMLFELLTGRPPFVGSTSQKIRQKVIQDDPPRPRSLNSSVDRDGETICLKCLEKRAEHRYKSAAALADDLEAWRDGRPISARTVNQVERAWKWMRRHPVKAALVATAGACLLLLAGLVVQWQISEMRVQENEVVASLKSAEEHFAADRADLAIASLARSLRKRPDNRAAAERLLNALAQRTFLVPSTVNVALPTDTSALSPDGARRVSGKGTNEITIIDVRGGGVVLRITKAHDLVIRDIRFSPDGKRFVSAGADSNAFVWQASTGERLLKLPHSAPVYHADFSPDGDLVVTASRDNAAHLWNGRNGTAVGSPMTHANSVRTARFSPDGRFILTASDDKTIRLWDPLTTTPASEPGRLLAAVTNAAFALDNQHIIAYTDDAVANVLLVTRPTPWSQASAEETALVYAPRTRSEAVTDFRRKITAQSGEEILDLDFSPDFRLAVVGYASHSARIWLTGTLKPQGAPLAHDEKVNSVRFSPDGVRLITSTPTGIVRLWDVPSGQPLSDPDFTGQPIVAVAFSSDGNWVITSAGLKAEVPRVEANVPAWLAPFGECLVSPVSGGGQSNREPRLSLTALQSLASTNRLARWMSRALGNAVE